MSDKGRNISWKAKTSLEEWHCGATGNSVDKDSKQRKLDCPSEGRLPGVEGHSLEQKRLETKATGLVNVNSW